MLTIQSSLEVPEPSHWPISMARFGKTSCGKNLFRVVYAPTVKRLIFGCDRKGSVGAHLRPAHRQIGDQWILEKYLTAEQATRLTAEEYEKWGPRDPQSGMLLDGPYSMQAGYYYSGWTFDLDTLHGGMEGAVEKIVGLIRAGEGKSMSQVKAENKELDDKEEKRAAQERFMRVREKEPLYGVRPANFAGRPKTVNHKTQHMPISANELRGMPRRRGSVVSMRGPQVNAAI